MGAVFMDSSAWFDYLFGPNPGLAAMIDSDALVLTSVISLFEVKRKLLQRGLPAEQREQALERIRKRSILFDVDKDLAESAADFSIKHKLSMADAFVYTTARARNAVLVTGDTDFAKLKGVRLLK